VSKLLDLLVIIHQFQFTPFSSPVVLFFNVMHYAKILMELPSSAISNRSGVKMTNEKSDNIASVHQIVTATKH